MNRDTVEGSWKQLKGKVKAQWGKLTGSHLEVIDGKRVELSGKVQEGYGITKDAAQQQVERLEERTEE
ncbi:MAG: CsbD family protein [Thiogranum sp.]